jgi:hypothetical protein
MFSLKRKIIFTQSSGGSDEYRKYCARVVDWSQPFSDGTTLDKFFSGKQA